LFWLLKENGLPYNLSPFAMSLFKPALLSEHYPTLQGKQLLTDSRKVSLPAQTVFFALSGANRDGHDFIAELLQKGVPYFVVSQIEKIDPQWLERADFFLVADTLQALQELAAFHRKQFKIPVIGITGSNGKTIVKEWLSQLLGDSISIVKSPKSYNSQIGVPLSVWEIKAQHQLAIFEAGISRPDEMEALAQIIRPQIGIFTNIGTAHSENFSSERAKIREKLKLFADAEFLIVRDTYPQIIQEVQAILPNLKIFGWATGQSQRDQVSLRYCDRSDSGYSVGLYDYRNQKTHHLHVPFTDPAHFENALHCIVVMLFFDYPTEEIQYKIERLRNIPMRLELKKGINNTLLIDDTYNNDLAGLKIALDFFGQNQQKSEKTAILSDLPEEGSSAEVYEKIVQLCAEQDISRIIGIGERFSTFVETASNPTTLQTTKGLIEVPQVHTFPHTAAFLKAFESKKIAFENEMILIKGGRRFEFEKIVQRLEQKIHGTKLEISLNALTHNLNFYRTLLNRRTKIMVMVKAFAYGSGNFEVAHLLQYHRVDYLAVAYADEGVALRENGIYLPIMVMNPTVESFETLSRYDLEPEIYSLRLLEEYLHFLEDNLKAAYRQNSKLSEEDLQKRYPIHLKLDTGMHRLGFEAQDLPILIDTLKRNSDRIKVVSLFSHLAGADEALHDDFSTFQIEQFKQLSAQIEKGLNIKPLKHLLNSAGIVRFPHAQFDMVRLGIGLYGVDSAGQYQDALLPIGTLKTTISQIKTLAPDQTVGYSRKGKLHKSSRIGTLAIGYADGYLRAFGNGVGYVYLHGKFAPTIGNICMDMCMIDLTEIEEAAEGDEVVIFGEKPTVSEMAARIGTIPYEILTNVGERVKRIFYAD
jgi:alanine racemase